MRFKVLTAPSRPRLRVLLRATQPAGRFRTTLRLCKELRETATMLTSVEDLTARGWAEPEDGDTMAHAQCNQMCVVIGCGYQKMHLLGGDWKVIGD